MQRALTLLRSTASDAVLPCLRQLSTSSVNYRHARGPDDEEETPQRILIPWVRTVINGVAIMRHPKFNKGLAFTNDERERLHLRGLLPPAVLSLQTQMERVVINVRTKASDLERYGYLQSLHERNEYLYYKVMREHISELLPIVHLPTVRQACKKYGLMFKSLPRCLFLTRQDLGDVHRVLKNWPERNIKVVMVTDGEKVGPAGDLGVHAVNAVIAKLSLITAVGGVNPSLTLPVQLDLGTNNDGLLSSTFYTGLRQRRMTGEAADELMHELMRSIENRFGVNTMLFFEDMKYRTAMQLLSQYGMRFPCFADDYQGLAATALAAALGAAPETGLDLKDHRILILGNGPHRVAIAEMLSSGIAAEAKIMASQARQNIFLVDDDGIVTSTSDHVNRELEETREVLLYSKDLEDSKDIEEIMDMVKPTMLISCSSTPRTMRPISDMAVRRMSMHTQRPVIFALSSPRAELSAAQAYHWSDGRAIYANFEGAQEEITTPRGTMLTPSKVQSVYIFPGLCLGVCAARSLRIKEDQIIAAARTVASMLTTEDVELGRVLPPISKVHEVAKQVALTVARSSYEYQIATALPKPADLEAVVDALVHDPSYVQFG